MQGGQVTSAGYILFKGLVTEMGVEPSLEPGNGIYSQ